jgi:hypothetical protein
MPNKKANVKNEKQYEALKDKGMSKGAGRQDRQLAGCLEPRRKDVRLVELPVQFEAGRDYGPEEGSRPQGRQGRRSQVLTG